MPEEDAQAGSLSLARHTSVRVSESQCGLRKTLVTRTLALAGDGGCDLFANDTKLKGEE